MELVDVYVNRRTDRACVHAGRPARGGDDNARQAPHASLRCARTARTSGFVQALRAPPLPRRALADRVLRGLLRDRGRARSARPRSATALEVRRAKRDHRKLDARVAEAWPPAARRAACRDLPGPTPPSSSGEELAVRSRARRGSGRRRPRRCRGGARSQVRVARRRDDVARRRARRRERSDRSSATQTSGPCSFGPRGVATVAPSSSRPDEEPVDEATHVLLDRRHADLRDQLHPCDAGVERRHRRRAAVEAPRRRVRRVVGDRHREDVLVGEPAGLRRAASSRAQLRPKPHERRGPRSRGGT